MNDQTFGERLRILRKRRGMTQTDLAKALGITVQTVVRYEGLELGEVRPERLKAFSEALGVEEWELTGEPNEDAAAAEEDIRILTRGLRGMEPERRRQLIDLMMPLVEEYRMVQKRREEDVGRKWKAMQAEENT